MTRALALALALTLTPACDAPAPARFDAPTDAPTDARTDAPIGIQPSMFDSNLGCRTARDTNGWFVALVILVLTARRGRRTSRVLAASILALPLHAQPSSFSAALETPEPTPPRRRFAATYDPLTVIIGRASINVETVPGSHHGVIATIYRLGTTTTDASFNTRYRGTGGELGYRYYSGDNGPRGVFVGPSLLLGTFTGTPRRGDVVEFSNIGGAVDLGYQAIVKGRLVLGLAFGLQYTWPSKTIAHQDLPASIYANRGLRPRFILAIGVAF